MKRSAAPSMKLKQNVAKKPCVNNPPARPQLAPFKPHSSSNKVGQQQQLKLKAKSAVKTTPKVRHHPEPQAEVPSSSSGIDKPGPSSSDTAPDPPSKQCESETKNSEEQNK